MVMWLDIKLMATAYSDLICDYLIGEIEHRVVLFSSVRCFYKKSCAHSSLSPD